MRRRAGRSVPSPQGLPRPTSGPVGRRVRRLQMLLLSSRCCAHAFISPPLRTLPVGALVVAVVRWRTHMQHLPEIADRGPRTPTVLPCIGRPSPSCSTIVWTPLQAAWLASPWKVAPPPAASTAKVGAVRSALRRGRQLLQRALRSGGRGTQQDPATVMIPFGATVLVRRVLTAADKLWVQLPGSDQLRVPITGLTGESR